MEMELSMRIRLFQKQLKHKDQLLSTVLGVADAVVSRQAASGREFPFSGLAQT